jgi:hypothetical protein
LLADEHRQVVALLLDLNEQGAADFLEVLVDLTVLALELLNQGALEHALLAAVEDEGVLAAVPVVLL